VKNFSDMPINENEGSLPSISVVIPTCHRNDLLAKCLDCLAPGVQTLAPSQYEVIVTDDGARSTAEQMMRDNYPWAKWTAGPRRGPATNRNHGAALARGEWLAFTDDDCLPQPEWLKAFNNAIRLDVHIYEGMTTCEAGLRSPLEHAPINLTGGWLWSCNMMVRKSIFEIMGGFDESFPHPHMEDTDFRERVKQNGYSFAFIQSARVNHPPRRVAWGAQRGAAQESEVMWYYKSGTYRFAGISLLKKTLGFRLRAIKHSPLSVDTLLASVSLLCELLYLLTKVRSWNLKYKDIYLPGKK